MSVTVICQWDEDGTATAYGRLMSRDGTGVSIAGEGKALKRADISSITYSVFDEDSPGTGTVTGTVTVSDCIFDTLKTSADDSVWTFAHGFNFRHDIPAGAFPTGGAVYTVEYKITTTGGSVGWARYRGRAKTVFTS